MVVRKISAKNVVSSISSKIEESIFVVDFNPESQDGTPTDLSQNDYDLQTGSWTNAVTAKLSRFIEIITNSKNTLADNFKPMPKSDSGATTTCVFGSGNQITASDGIIKAFHRIQPKSG